VSMSPPNAQQFRKEVASVKRDANFQRLICVDQNPMSGVLGWIPGPHTIPDFIKKWWGGPEANVTIYLDEFRIVRPGGALPRGAIMIFMSEETGKLWIWTYEFAKKDTS